MSKGMDSTVSGIRMLWTEPVAEASARLEIPADSLFSLPAGASFRADSGRAHVDVRRGKGGMVIVSASCDSLQQRCWYYENLLENYRTAHKALETELREEQKKRENPLRAFFAGFGTGAFMATGILSFIKLKKNYSQNSNG